MHIFGLGTGTQLRNPTLALNHGRERLSLTLRDSMTCMVDIPRTRDTAWYLHLMHSNALVNISVSHHVYLTENTITPREMGSKA